MKSGERLSNQFLLALDEFFKARPITGGTFFVSRTPLVTMRSTCLPAKRWNSYNQSRAERQFIVEGEHGRTRRRTLAEDHRWNKNFGFAGTE